MTIPMGSQVWLKGLRGCGAPGTVIKETRGKLVVFWADLDHWSNHHPDSLELVEQIHEPQPLPASLARCLECEENTHNG